MSFSENNRIINEGDIVLYITDQEEVKINVAFINEDLWLTQKSIAELFNVKVPAISKHLKNIFESGELIREATVSKMEIVQYEGDRQVVRELDFFNLDAIIAVGYRVNSYEATQFRKWATQTLREFIVKGFVLNDEMLKNGKPFGKDYFDELLERIREIRASERRFYQKITDIYAQCSVDYDPNAEMTKEFYATVQNKLHYSVTGHTAAEIIASRVCLEKEYMGLKTWKNAPGGKILKSDVVVAKNYLDKEEIDNLNRLVTMYLDYAENQAKKKNVMKMEDWISKLEAFLTFNDYEVLKGKGKIQAKVAKALAEDVYSQFRVKQDREYISDFDKEIEKQLGGGQYGNE